MSTKVFAQEKKQGIVLTAIDKQGTLVAQPGDILKYTDSDNGTWLHTSSGEVEVYRDQITPLDERFTPARVYIWIQEHPLKRTRQNSEEFHRRFLLCRELAKRFPSHELAETFGAMACDYYIQSEGIKTMGKSGWEESVAIIDDFLARYPNGENADRLHFKRFELLNDPYEYEGSVRLILDSIERYQNYLVSHPHSSSSHRVRTKLARLYAMAYECFPKDSTKERQWVRSKALKLYGQLAKSDDLETRQRAQIALFNLKQGRRTYSGPNDW
jgi:hypothetical protein